MGDLINDPVGWTGTMVDSWLSFTFFAVFFVAITGFTVYIAAFHGWFPAIGPAIFVAGFHIYFLYALRRLYLIVTRAPTRIHHVA